MLVVKVEIWPFGSKDSAKEISRVFIYNDGTGDSQVGNYVGVIGEVNNDRIDRILDRKNRRVEVKGYKRNDPKNHIGPLKLVREILEKFS